jgi:hypothetical protein
MKDKCFIYYGNPCTACLTDSEVRTFEDAQGRGPRSCPFLGEREKCSPPRFGCVAVAGARMARCVLQFYTQASEETLALDREFFRRRGPLPPKDVEAYIDTAEYSYRRITDPDLVVQRVSEYARAALDLEEGERVARVPGRFEPPGEEVLAVLQRETEGRKVGKKAGERAKPLVRPAAREQVPGTRPA